MVATKVETKVEQRLHRLRQRVAAILARHGRALLLLSAGLALIQALVIAHRPSILGSPDGNEYLGVATNIISYGRVFDPLRTPGYPLLLALVMLVRGGPDLVAVVAVQIALTVAAAFELYTLAYRLMGKPMGACAVALLVGANTFVLNWEFVIRAETLAYFVVVTLALVAERLLHRLRPSTLIWVGVLLFFEILVRPIDIFLPALLLGALALRGVWMGRGRESLLRLGTVTLLVYGSTLGYILLNHAVTGYAGLSEASNVNIFGKVIEYHLQDLPVTPDLTPVQRDTAQFVRDLGPGPYVLTGRPWAFARTHGYDRDFYEPVGAYGRYVALHYPQDYIPATLREIRTDWWEAPILYDPGTRTIVSQLLDHASQLSVQVAYIALPVLAAWLLWRLRKDPGSPATFFLLLLLAAAAALIVLVAVGCYDESTRLRSPLDWAPLAVAGILGIEAGADIIRAAKNRSPQLAHLARRLRASRPTAAQDASADASETMFH